MPSQRNQQILEEIVKRLSDKSLIVTARYSNVNATQMNDLRREVTKGGGNVYIAKNNLVALAAGQLGISNIKSIIDGPTAYITADGDIAATVKALADVIREQDLNIEILGGVMEEQLIPPERVRQIAELPSREQLIGMLASVMNSPLTGLARVLNAPVQNLASVLQQIADQQKESEPA